jgi:hypothetical protein
MSEYQVREPLRGCASAYAPACTLRSRGRAAPAPLRQRVGSSTAPPAPEGGAPRELLLTTLAARRGLSPSPPRGNGGASALGRGLEGSSAPPETCGVSPCPLPILRCGVLPSLLPAPLPPLGGEESPRLVAGLAASPESHPNAAPSLRPAALSGSFIPSVVFSFHLHALRLAQATALGKVKPLRGCCANLAKGGGLRLIASRAA